jgi:hypothetical protein
MMVERICYACKGRGFLESRTGVLITCITCNGGKVVLEPDEEACRLMVERVLEEK